MVFRRTQVTNTGEEIFKTNCTACHSLKMPSDMNKSLCMPMAVKRFGVMPPVKGLTKEQRTAVGEWLYDNLLKITKN